jgi:kynurenine formamidase
MPRHPFLPILASSLVAIGAVARAAPPEPRRPPALDRARIIDLSHTFDQRTLYWPTATSGFQLTSVHHGRTPAGFFYSANSFCAPEHGGTHLDAPVHFAEGRQALDQVPLERLIAPAVVIDVARQAAADADYRLTAEDVRAWESRHGRIPEGAVVLLRTGWAARWPDAKRYLGDDTPGEASRLHFPAFGADAARLLVEERRAGMLGVDTASIDHGPSRDFVVHQIAAAADVAALENLADLGALPEVGGWVMALPMKIGGGSGGPVRVVALVPR